MTERDYIDATELAYVRIAIQTLREITIASSATMNKGDYGEILEKLIDWRSRLYLILEKKEGSDDG